MTSITNPPPASASPALTAGYPSRFCRNCGITTVVPYKHDSQHEREEHRRGEIAPLEKLDIHDRRRMPPFPDDPANQTDDGENEHDRNPRRGEPVFLLPLIEHELQAGDAQRDQAQAHVVDAEAPHLLPLRLQIRRIFHQPMRQEQRQDRRSGTLM